MGYFMPKKLCFFYPYNKKMKELEKINKLIEILEESGVGNIIESALEKDSVAGRKGYNPYDLFVAVLYGFSKHSGSIRKIEESMIYDTRFMYIMENQQPTYVTISNFFNDVIVLKHKEIYTTILKTILTKYDINTDDVFIDGTKFEANANKYKFVWKPTTFHKKLNANIRNLVTKYIDLPPSKKWFTSKEIGTYLTEIKAKFSSENIDVDKVVRGRGHKVSSEAKDYFKLCDYLIKALEYEEKEIICGKDRKSYFKTDHDATAMCMKDDYYAGAGSNMKAGYCVQIAVSRGIILDYYVSQDRTDTRTLIPFLDEFNKNYGKYPKNLCADAGYGSLLNYEYISKNGIGNYVKYNYWQLEKDGKSVEYYTFNDDVLVCLNGKIGEELDTYNGRHPKSKQNKYYVVRECVRCKYKEYCNKPLKNKNSRERVFETNSKLYKYKLEAKQNLLSVKGIEMRVNRSAQVEGAFGVIKQDMDYERVRRRGLDKVYAEIMMVCLGYVVKKLFILFDGKNNLDYWVAPTNLKPEEFKKINIEKIINKQSKKKSVNQIAKEQAKKKKS